MEVMHANVDAKREISKYAGACFYVYGQDLGMQFLH